MIVAPRRCLLPLMVALLATTACFSRPAGQAPGAKATPTPTPRQRLDDASKKMQGVSAFHFLLTHQNGFSQLTSGLDMTRAEGDFVSPDRLKAAVKGTVQGLPVSVSVIGIGQSSWITNPLQSGEHYQPLQGGPQTAEILAPNRGLLKAANEMNQPRLSGAERIGRVDTLIISGDVDAGNLKPIATDAEAGRMVPTQVWVGKEDLFIYRVKLSGPISSTEPKNIVRQIDLSQFNERLDITPPVTGALESKQSV